MAATHPSFFALDQYAAGGGAACTRDHVAGCAHCQAHVERVRTPPVIPEWVAPAPPRRWPMLAALAGSMAVVVFLAVVPIGRRAVSPLPVPLGAVSAAPELKVFVQQGRGGTPGTAGYGTLRVGVGLDQAAHVTIYAERGDGQADRAFDGWLEAGAPALVVQSWSLDDEPRPERLWVIATESPGPWGTPVTTDGLRWVAARPWTRVKVLTLER